MLPLGRQDCGKTVCIRSVQDCISVSSVADPVNQSEDPMERTKKFVEQMNQQMLAPMKKSVMESTQLYNSWRGTDRDPTPVTPKVDSTLNSLAKEFLPIASFLLKKELLIHKLVNFNDKPENFKSITLEASISPEEELDLLIR